MKGITFEYMRIWAALTGLALAVWYFVALWLDAAPSHMLPMLVTAIGGFEMFLFGQDLFLKRKRRHG